MSQLDLSLWGPPAPRELARLEDPDTSHAAARALAGKAGTMRRRLLAVYVKAPGGLTAEEAADRAGFDPAEGPWKRVSDLTNMDLIRPTGKTRAASSGRQQRVLRITDAGREALGA